MLYDTSSLIFLSTLSLRRATKISENQCKQTIYFYPRSPCGERPPLTSRAKTILAISIHALLAESDHAADISARREASISIHALLAESDHRQQNGPIRYSGFLSTLSLRRATPRPQPTPRPIPNFYPRSPCGERR